MVIKQVVGPLSKLLPKDGVKMIEIEIYIVAVPLMVITVLKKFLGEDSNVVVALQHLCDVVLSLRKSAGERIEAKEIKTDVVVPEICEDLASKLKNLRGEHVVLSDCPGGEDYWGNPEFVRVPTSLQSKVGDTTCAGWKFICRELSSLKRDCEEGKFRTSPEDIGFCLETMINSFAGKSEGETSLSIDFPPDFAKRVAEATPVIVDHALRLPEVLKGRIPILKAGQNKTLYLKKDLVCSLLANAFFCTLPQPWDDMPEINFRRLFQDSGSNSSTELKREKLLCLLNYFKMTADQEFCRDRIVSYNRKCISNKLNWNESEKRLCAVEVETKKLIEDAEGMLQVDFANKVVGGGVLGNGCVMEEIRFATCPELILSRLFTETLADDEVLVVTGTEQFTRYTGYAATFKFVGPIENSQKNLILDDFDRLKTEVVAMDAVKFDRNRKSQQFQPYFIDRELHKAYVAFETSSTGTNPTSSVATGNWGCGVFNGDLELKFVIQWMAASQASRPSIHYHTVGDKAQANLIIYFAKLLQKNQVTVGGLYKMLLEYHEDAHFQKSGLFAFIEQAL